MNIRKNGIGALLVISAAFLPGVSAQENHNGPNTKVFVIGAVDKYHSPMVNKAEAMVEKICRENQAELHFTRDTSELTLSRLARYDVLVQLQLAPYDMSPSQQYAVQQFICKGKGWIGIHAAGLTGRQFEKDSSLYWKWFEHLMGDVVYSPHPPFQHGVVQVMDTLHPVTRNLPHRFSLGDEWYEYDRVPAMPSDILAAADESTYQPRNPMGYHPVIWTNPLYNRALFISIGHDTSACNNPAFQLLIKNALNWAADQKGKEEKQMHDYKASAGTVLVNQVGYNDNLPKQAMFKSRFPFSGNAQFYVVDARTLQKVFFGSTGKSIRLTTWDNNWYCPLDFSTLNRPGYYKIVVNAGGREFESFDFQIGPS
jgi:type 1 glutamine amidotransferase